MSLYEFQDGTSPMGCEVFKGDRLLLSFLLPIREEQINSDAINLVVTTLIVQFSDFEN